jgi:Na+-translocating ferredoxin:NAD+ oxidoreductase RnfD subunit
MFKDKELRGYIGAATVFLLVMGLLLFLAFFEIPDTNNDIFKVIVGMLVGSLSVVIYTFIGKNPEEVELEALLRDLQNEVIEKLSITGGKFEFKSNGKNK